MNALGDRDARIDDLERRISVLEQVCAEAYQLVGAVGAPVKALDNLAAAAAGKPIPHETFCRCPRRTAMNSYRRTRQPPCPGTRRLHYCGIEHLDYRQQQGTR